MKPRLRRLKVRCTIDGTTWSPPSFADLLFVRADATAFASWIPKNRVERIAERLVAEDKAACDRFCRKDALTSMQKFVGELTTDPMQDG